MSEPTQPDQAGRSSAVQFVGQVASWLLLLVAVGVLAATIVVPRLAGATPYTILTGSMAPQMPPGTLVVTREADFDRLEVGDVVTYQLESGQSAVVTHRIVGFSTSATGERTLITRGDANDTEDALPVREVQVRGQVWYHVPVVGRLNALISGDQHMAMMVLAVSGLLLYAGFQFAGALLGRHRSRRTTTTTAVDPAGAPERELVSS